MPLTRVCPQCGAALPKEGWEGLCPKCLVRVSLEMAGGEAEAGHRPAAQSAGERPEGEVRPSSIAKIADPKSTVEPPRTRCVGDYELLKEIARGGMGVVYRARQLSLNRIVAVKMMLSGQFASAADVQRFRSEAEAAANLDHPNIVAIHEVGEHDGQQYFSMDYVEGRNLAEVVRERPLGARPAAQYVQIIAEAIHYAHRCGTLHRDLKPSNVLIDAADQPRITDFGLAKRVTESSPATARSGNPALEAAGSRSLLVDPRADLTLTGQVLGSPNFMPPEQAVGRRGEVGPHSDVYSLGAILYHLLTGRPPFLAETFTEVLQQVQQVDAISPRLLHPAVPRDLETICLKCLEKEPRRRYATAEELAEELRRFLSGEPVRARPLGSMAKVWRWCRRKPALAGALAACAAAVVLGVGGIAWQWRRAQGKANESRTRLVRQYVMNGNRQVSQGDFAGALSWFAEALKLEANIPARAEMHRLRLTLAAQRCPKPVQIWSHQAGLNYAEFSPDGRWVVVACDDHVALVWDAMTGHPVGPPLPHMGRVLYATWAPDGAHLATACADGTARVWNVTNANPLLWTLKHSGAVVHAKFNHDGSRLVTSSDDATAQVWDVQTGAAVLPALKHKESVRHAEFSPDDLWVVTAGDDKSVRLWDAATGQSVGPTMWRASVVRHAEFSSDGRRILMLGEKVATVFDRIKNHYYETQHDHSLLAGAFSPDGNNFVVGGMGYRADLFNTADGKAIGHSMDHSAEVMDVGFSPDGRFIITASRDRTARVWDRSGAPATGPLWHLKPVTHAAFSPDGHHALSVSEDQMIRIWELSRSLPEIPTLHPVTVVSHAAFNPDNRRLLTVGLNGAVDLWDGPTGHSNRQSKAGGYPD
ncbi:MAG TPA: protein kinase [Verrucomicrobiae bacterium]|nr:protein kinase [Verrucomicrobiae bacterium]